MSELSEGNNHLRIKKYISVCCSCGGEGHFDAYMTVDDECPFCKSRCWIIYICTNGKKELAGAMLGTKIELTDREKRLLDITSK